MAVTPVFSSGYICPQRVDNVIIQEVVDISGSILQMEEIAATIQDLADVSGSILQVEEITAAMQEVVDVSGSVLQMEEIAASISCENGGYVLTDIVLIRRNSRRYRFTVTDNAQNPPVPVNLTDSIVKFAVKKKTTQTNLGATILKTSYDPAQIVMTDPVAGIFTVVIAIEDTSDDCLGSFVWDANVTRRDGVSTNTGTMDFTASSESILCTGVDFDALQVGDIVVPAGANTSPFTVISVDEASNTITTDRTDFATETGAAFVAYRGKRDTVASGTFTITADQAQ